MTEQTTTPPRMRITATYRDPRMATGSKGAVVVAADRQAAAADDTGVGVAADKRAAAAADGDSSRAAVERCRQRGWPSGPYLPQA
jgi:hypothetical protein